ncbi:MAG: UDP-N-acetylglucosamine 1-carboxyvinyltransferase, partial [Leptolyngbyaceae cyanobacterium SM1_3_5]|nr:UDP-N-acetylglucosamine 1-carboxyvinyltransferase [Leptolyngbyaceae cyanobacterium SM1_3_5]
MLQVWGKTPLAGQVKISGAKNSALVIMAGALLCPQDCRLRNLPAVADVAKMGELLSALGLELRRQDDVLEIDARHVSRSQAPYELVSRMRASFFIIGPLLARMG